MTAREALRQWWVAVPPLTLGWLSGPAFFYAGARARRRPWIVAGFVYLATGIGGFSLVGSDELDGPLEDAGTALTLLTWVGATGHAFAIRRRYLTLVYSTEDERLEAAEAQLAARERARELAAEDPVRARELGVGRPDLPDAYDGGLVDLNHAPAAVIATLPRIGPELAERIVATREELEGFDSIEDLADLLEIKPSTVERLRIRAVCLPY